MNIPELWYKVEFQQGVNNKLSLIPPYNQCTVTISCNEHIKTFRCRSTYENEPTGKDEGVLVVEMTSQPANTQIPFILNATGACKSGEGTYTIGLYVENDEGIWNVYSFFLTTEAGGIHLTLQDNSNDYFMVQD